LDKYHPGYFGKVGMRYFHKQKNPFWKPATNIEKVSIAHGKELHITLAPALTNLLLQLWSLVPTEQREKFLSGKSQDTAPVIDLLSFGYAKLLGKGRLPKIPIVVKARYVSAEAEKKIKEAGGVVQLVA
jgi:ribosomal protein L15